MIASSREQTVPFDSLGKGARIASHLAIFHSFFTFQPLIEHTFGYDTNRIFSLGIDGPSRL
jgi:hypothetical protein